MSKPDFEPVIPRDMAAAAACLHHLEALPRAELRRAVDYLVSWSVERQNDLAKIEVDAFMDAARNVTEAET